LCSEGAGAPLREEGENYELTENYSVFTEFQNIFSIFFSRMNSASARAQTRSLLMVTKWGGVLLDQPRS
jgi:hypothetical protein